MEDQTVEQIQDRLECVELELKKATDSRSRLMDERLLLERKLKHLLFLEEYDLNGEFDPNLDWTPLPESYKDAPAGWHDIQPEQYVTSEKIVEKGPVVKRTWKERLFTRPWKPFEATKQTWVPALGQYQFQDKLVCHPESAHAKWAKGKLEEP